MTGLDLLIVMVVALIVAVLLLPLIVLIDLAGGGSGLGICEGSLATCRTSYFDGPELLALLLIVLFLLTVVLRSLLRARSGSPPQRRVGNRR
jgi:hypothetical protein